MSFPPLTDDMRHLARTMIHQIDHNDIDLVFAEFRSWALIAGVRFERTSVASEFERWLMRVPIALAQFRFVSQSYPRPDKRVAAP